MDWLELAACRGEHGSLFFGPSESEPRRARDVREAAAKAICARCPVVRPCRQEALARGELYGVWGGLGELERRSVLARLAG